MKHTGRNAAALSLLLTAWCFLTVAGADFAGDILLREARNAAMEFLGAELSVDGITGNPIQGFSTGRITLSTEQGAILSAASLRLKISPKSLLSLKPAVNAFSIVSADIDGDILAERLSSLAPVSGGRSVTLQRAEISGSRITFGKSRADISLIGLSFAENTVSADMGLTVNSVPFSGTAAIDLTEGEIALRSLFLRAGSGEIAALGTITPFLSVAGLASGLDLSEISLLWPPSPRGTFTGKLTMSFTGEGKWNSPVLAGDAALEDGSIRGIPVDRAKGRWSFSENSFSASPVEGTVLSSPVRGTLSLIFPPGKAPSLEASFSGKTFRTENAKSLLPASVVKGMIDTFSGRVSGTADSLSGMVNIGARSLTLFGLSASNTELQADFTPASLKLKGKTGLQGATADFSGIVENYAASPRLNITAAIRSISLQKAGSLLKDLPAAGLSGSVNADLAIKGAPAAPEISGRVWSSGITAGKESFTSPSASFSYRGGQTVVSSAAAQWRGASLTAGGKISRSTKGTALDLSITASGADLAALSGVLGVPFPLGGKAGGTVSLKGTAFAPAFTVKATSPSASLHGITVTQAEIQLSGTAKAFRIDRFTAGFKGGTLSGSGTVKPGKAPDAALDISVKNIDLRSLIGDVSAAGGLSVSGKVNGTFKGRVSGGKTSFAGTATSAAISTGGLRATHLSIPLSLEGDVLRGKDASLAFYGGKLTGSGTMNIKTMKYTVNASFSGVDVNSAVHAFAGDLGGKVTGQARGSLQASGALSPAFNVTGKGRASVSAGAVSGFRNVDIAARLYGTQGIRYTGAVIPFRLETGRLVLEKGTRADAPKDDPMYRFLTAEGTVGPRGALNLSCAGNVNMKLFNALRGGAAGGLSGGSLEDAVKGLLGGFSKGMAEEDFRDTTFSVRGTVGNPSIANLKTAPPPPKQQAPAQAPAQPPSPPPQTPKPKTPEEILKEKLLESIFKK